MKKITLIILILFMVGTVSGCVSRDNNPIAKDSSPVGEAQNKQYTSPDTRISFTYPKKLTVSTTNAVTLLRHDIPYKNSGACDMMGDEKKYARLTDFEMKIRIVNKNLTETVKTLSPYIPKENFVKGKLIASPGFIDPYTNGNFSGFAIYEGAEGCGQTTYYFPVTANKTLVISNASIQALSGVITQEKVNEVLAIPGVISREKNKEIFEFIVRNLKVN